MRERKEINLERKQKRLDSEPLHKGLGPTKEAILALAKWKTECGISGKIVM